METTHSFGYWVRRQRKALAALTDGIHWKNSYDTGIGWP
jgi:hypothetical protein